MTQDQIVLLLDLKASKERGAASMSCGQREGVAEGLVKMKMISKHPSWGGYFINDAGLKWLEKRKDKVK